MRATATNVLMGRNINQIDPRRNCILQFIPKIGKIYFILTIILFILTQTIHTIRTILFFGRSGRTLNAV